MKKLTFKMQFMICMGFLIFSFVLANITKQGIFTNIAWIIYGLFFIVNPVWPQAWDWKDHNTMTLGCRIGGTLVILIGLITRFGV